MRTIKRYTTFFLLTLLMMSCRYDNELELYGNNECKTTEVSYIDDVQPVLQQSCLGCHSAAANFGNVTLEGYASVKEYVDNERLIGSITHMDGFAEMPQNAPQLSSCTLAKIESWVNDGAPNN